MKYQKYVCLMLSLALLCGCDEAEKIQNAEYNLGGTVEIVTVEPENGDGAMEAEKLLDAFMNNEAAVLFETLDGDKGSYRISNLCLEEGPDVDVCDIYSIGERVDLDNDGERELIINNIYGGMYIDARNGALHEFERGEGTGDHLSYCEYQGKNWVVHSDTMHGGRVSYRLSLYQGADQCVDTLSLYKEDSDDKTIYYINDSEVSEKEYQAYYDEIFSKDTM